MAGTQNVVKLNIGGIKYETTTSTINRYSDSMIGRLISNEWNFDQSSNEFFIDRDGHFRYILNYYRYGNDIILPENPNKLKEIKYEAEYYLLPGLLNLIDSIPEICQFTLGNNVKCNPNSTQKLAEIIYWAKKETPTSNERYLTIPISGIDRNQFRSIYQCNACGYSKTYMQPDAYTVSLNDPWYPAAQPGASTNAQMENIARKINNISELIKGQTDVQSIDGSYLELVTGKIESIIGNCLMVSGFAPFLIHVPKTSMVLV